jgi:hypothetical protein
MWFFKKLLAPREAKDALALLATIGDELALPARMASPPYPSACGYVMFSLAFSLVQREVEQLILDQPREFAKMIKAGTNLREWMLCAIANVAGDYVESDDYHYVDRGWVTPLGEGLLLVFDTAGDELVRMGAVDADYARRQKAQIRENIEDDD